MEQGCEQKLKVQMPFVDVSTLSSKSQVTVKSNKLVTVIDWVGKGGHNYPLFRNTLIRHMDQEQSRDNRLITSPLIGSLKVFSFSEMRRLEEEKEKEEGTRNVKRFSENE